MDILIVEDEEKGAEILTHSFNRWGYRPVSASTGEEALNMALNKKFDLVLLDIFLPDMRGHELIPKIKDVWPETKFIAMTGFNSKSLEKEVRGYGVIYYMLKPFENNHLKAILDHIAGELAE